MEEVNSDGLTEDEVWDMKDLEANLFYDENFENQTYHFIIAGIHIRNITDMHPM